MILHPQEEAAIRAFFTKHHQREFLSSVTNKKTRDQAMQRLARSASLDKQYARRVTGDRSAEAVHLLLTDRGAPSMCHIIGNTQFDGQDMDLHTALEEHLCAFCDVLISCLPGRLAYFHGHDPGDDYILERFD